jgi:adenylate cyclase
VELLRAVGVETETAIGDAGGVVVKRLGDGVMVAFDSVDHAADAVFDLRQRLESVDVDGYRPRMRSGLHCGRGAGSAATTSAST